MRCTVLGFLALVLVATNAWAQSTAQMIQSAPKYQF